MKLSDYVINFVSKFSDSIFLVSGGGIIHLVDSVRQSKLKTYCCHHEQAAATCAEGWARIKNKPGVCLVTTGPGSTNAITGVAGAWLDSIPMLVISGQVKKPDIVPKKSGLRQIGFQEINIIDMVKPITKYAKTVLAPNQIRYHLEKAVYLASHGRPGPVWINIPLDIQATNIKTNQLTSFKPAKQKTTKIPIKTIVRALKQSKRPLLMAGNGIRLAGAEKILWKLINKIKINVVTPIFTADDLVTPNYPQYLGSQGIPGNETANRAIDNCDLLLIIGERMQLTQTSYEHQNFNPLAKKIMVDINPAVLNKKTFQADIKIKADAKKFLELLYKQKIKLNPWRVKFGSINFRDYQGSKNYINVYQFLQNLNKHIDKYPIVTANGMASLTSHQTLDIKRGQRFITNAGLGQMGSGLPLSIGACVASNNKTTICLTGDGSIMFNLHELETIKYHQLPIKIFIFNNGGYYSVRSTHQNYFGKTFAADVKTGVSLPNFEKLITGWGIKYLKIANDKDLVKIKQAINFNGPAVTEVMIDPNQPTFPKWIAGQYNINSKNK